jgi:hypothetical protein
VKPWIADEWIVAQAEVPQKIKVRFSVRGREQSEAFPVGKKSKKITANPQGAPASLVLRQFFEACAHGGT